MGIVVFPYNLIVAAVAFMERVVSIPIHIAQKGCYKARIQSMLPISLLDVAMLTAQLWTF